MEAQDRERLLEETAKQPGYFYADLFRKVSESLAVERWPFPPSDHVTIARIVHLLAMRTVAKRHSSMPAGKALIVPHEARYLAYLDAALTLNDAIDRAAKAGAFALRERSTGVAVPDWHLPTWDRRDFLKRAILEGDHRRAIEFVVSSGWLIVPYPHFTSALTVSQSEFSTWAEKEGIASPDEIGRLLADQTKEIPGPAEILKTAFPIFGGDGRHDPGIFDAGLYPERTAPEAEQQAGPDVADQGAPASDANEPPQEWRNGLKRMAYEEAVKLVREHGVLHGPALWAAMCAREDVKPAGRESDQIELKVCGSKLTRGEARVSKTQVQNGWRKGLAELLR